MTDTEVRQVRPFAAFLQEQRGGETHAELSEGLARLVAAVVEHGKPGTLTLQIKVRPTGDGISLFVTDAIGVKAPSGERSAALFFADDAGNLSRKDPRQIELPLREVTAPAAPRTIDRTAEASS